MKLDSGFVIKFSTVSFWISAFSFGYLFSTYNKESNKPLRFQLTDTQVSAGSISPSPSGPQVLSVGNISPNSDTGRYLTVSTNEPVTIAGDDINDTKLLEKTNTAYIYEIQLANQGESDHRLDFNLTNGTGNTTNHQVELQNPAINNCLLKKDRKIKIISDPTELLLIIDKYHKLKEPYMPPVLYNAKLLNLPVIGSGYLIPEAMEALQKMIQEIQAQKINVTISSGWRRYSSQEKVFRYWVNTVGHNSALGYAALPGHSEHHLGTAVDLLTSENGYTTSAAFEDTKLGTWLRKNAHKYGFTMSYPKGKESVTGYNFEPWHYRFVGISTASEIKKQKISPAEYLYTLHNETCD